MRLKSSWRIKFNQDVFLFLYSALLFQKTCSSVSAANVSCLQIFATRSNNIVLSYLLNRQVTKLFPVGHLHERLLSTHMHEFK